MNNGHITQLCHAITLLLLQLLFCRRRLLSSAQPSNGITTGEQKNLNLRKFNVIFFQSQIFIKTRPILNRLNYWLFCKLSAWKEGQLRHLKIIFMFGTKNFV
jgi:hypothetical protein